jgi:hypothetical protein
MDTRSRSLQGGDSYLSHLAEASREAIKSEVNHSVLSGARHRWSKCEVWSKCDSGSELGRSELVCFPEPDIN